MGAGTACGLNMCACVLPAVELVNLWHVSKQNILLAAQS